jgi:hypothetical protein
LTPAATSSATENAAPRYSDHEVEGLRYCLTYYSHSGKIGKPGSEQHIRSRLFEGLKAADGLIQLWRGVEEIVRTRRQHKGKRERTRRLRSRSNPFNR